MKKHFIYIVTAVIFSSILLLASCEKVLPPAPEENELLDGTVEGLTGEQSARFLRGDAAVNEVFTAATGLGPVFVSTSCISCHAGDGKGHPFTTLTRFGQSDSTGNLFLNQGAPQLQNRAISGFIAEKLPQGAPFAKFTAPAFTGLGFLQYVTDQDLLKLADPNDANNDGISGVPSWGVLPSTITPSPNAVVQNGKYLHRFGKKASAYDLLHQTVNAYNQDMGIASAFDPIDAYSGLAIDPEVSNQKINDIVHYLSALKAPIQRNPSDNNVIAGKSIFQQINCSGCHTPSMKTGNAPIAALSNKTFYPYSDMLLHDMGKGLDDGYTEGSATSAEWRTPPLWGLGLSKDSQGGKYYLLHDGRATSIEAAILAHGGEAQRSKTAYEALSAQEKKQLIQFLESL
jgi:CxxC motif-containing protein (DUF1111 family)